MAKNRRPACNPLPVVTYNMYVYIFYTRPVAHVYVYSRVHMIMRFGFVKNRYTFGGGDGGGSSDGGGGGNGLTCTFGIIYYVYYIFFRFCTPTPPTPNRYFVVYIMYRYASKNNRLNIRSPRRGSCISENLFHPHQRAPLHYILYA